MFSSQFLTHLAKETKFVRRTSKFRAQDLAALCIGMGQDIAGYSLTRLCGVLESETGVLISPEELNVCLNTKAVEFLRSLFSQLLQKQLLATMSLPSSFSEYFRRIRILDATTFQVSDQLAAVYPGSGGSGKASGVKIQLEYNLLSGQFSHVGCFCPNPRRDGQRCPSYKNAILSYDSTERIAYFFILGRILFY